MKNEEWRPISGFEGLYLVGSHGNVWSLRKAKALKQKLTKTGYPSVNLYKNEACFTRRVHRLVADAFIENVDDKPCVNHKDSDRCNNFVGNLEWVTHKENTLHAYRLGRIHIFERVSGEKASNAKLKEKQVVEIRKLLKTGATCASISKLYNVTAGSIENIKNSHTWTNV